MPFSVFWEAGYAADLEKYLEATLASWQVVRLGPRELMIETVDRVVEFCS